MQTEPTSVHGARLCNGQEQTGGLDCFAQSCAAHCKHHNVPLECIEIILRKKCLVIEGC